MYNAYFSQITGVSLPVGGCGLNSFLPPIILSVCICGHVFVLSIQVSTCTFTHSHTQHAYCQNGLGLFVALPTMTTNSNVKNFFFFFPVLLCFIHIEAFCFLICLDKLMEPLEYFCPATDWDFTLPRGTLVRERDLKHKLNHGFVPNCYMFSI